MRAWTRGLTLLALAGLGGLASPPPAAGQDVGTMSWQLDPLCTTVTVAVTGAAPIFHVAGFLDSCGGPTLYPAFGTAVADATGAIRLGLTVVLPSAVSTSLHLLVDPASGTGSWTQPLGQSGALVPLAFVPVTAGAR